ncbi:hypothetical protein [Nocardioides okcheonensis]|uniref:hypothetical protein n=1 Tax=Nocardioides okcheonensis TaxID=2894081 RepID=UPI001E3214F7|nr:hypothetical protein [Nocardioides okcheonensis]UFN43210.1 hypothetical protein LN652_14280 [Nocardioides okcheonensis]
MKPVSGAMLLVAAALTSPTLAGAAMGTVPVDVALARYLVVAAISWVLLALAAEWLWTEPPSTAVAGQASPAAGSADDDATLAAGDATEPA